MTNQNKAGTEKIQTLMRQVFRTRINHFELVDFHINEQFVGDYYHGTIIMSDGLIFNDGIERLHISNIGLIGSNGENKIELTITMSKKDYDNLYME